MPCLILTGHPCAGKTTFANLLKERALKHESGLIDRVVVVNEESVCVNQTKSECYATSHAEKATRSALKGEVDRQLAPRTLVILDSLNYIKGYRYELHCTSKAAGERHGVVWILNSAVREWNQQRYSEQLLDELIQRFEPPDARNRWDQPLYRVDLTPSGTASSTNQAAQDALQRSVYNMHSLSDAITDSAAASPAKPRAKSAASSFRKRPSSRAPTATDSSDKLQETKPPEKNEPIETTKDVRSLEERIDEILDSFLLNVKPLKEGTSTAQHISGDANVLHQVDSLTQKVCAAISQTPSNGTIQISEYNVTVKSGRKLGLPELKRLRQQYIRWVAQHPPADTSERGIVLSFVEYVEGHV
jgi:protein KTI12